MAKTIQYVANTRLPSRRAKAMQVVNMSNAFVKAGYDVELVYPRRNQPQDAPTESVEEYYGEIAFEMRAIPCVDFVKHAPDLPSPVAKLVFYLQSVTFSLAALWYLHLRRTNIVYSRARIFTAFATLLGYTDVFYEVHREPGRFDRLLSPAYARVDGLVSISENLCSEWELMTDAPILVAPDGVDWERFSTTDSTATAREEIGLPVDRDVVCYTGSLKQWKGVDTLVKAAYHLDEDTLVYIVGGTERQRSRLAERVGDISPNISFDGHIPPTQIPTVLTAADVLVLPNSSREMISAKYTSPLKLFEYMAAGKPIVASDLSSVREVLDESTARLIPPDDPEALAKGIRFILDNPDYAVQLGEQARAGGAQYSWVRRAENITSFCLEQSLEGKS